MMFPSEIRPPVVLALLLALSATGSAKAAESSCGVKYVSAEHVYLDAGSASGLTVGLQVRIVRESATYAVLEVVFTAEYSASCKILNSQGEILPGDTAVFQPVEVAEAPQVSSALATPQRTRTFANDSSQPVTRPGPRLSGSVAIQWDHSSDSSGNGLSSDFLRLPFRVRVNDLGPGLEFRSRGALRHISRGGYISSVADSQWRNRIQEVALVREGRQRDFHYAVGRIGSRHIASAGTFDGFRLDQRVKGGFRLGAFGGFAPDWGTMSFSTENKLAGISSRFNHRTEQGRYLDVNLAGVGRYSGGEVSREYLTMYTSWRNNSGLTLLQGAEVDINRKWRKTDRNSSLELTSLALTGRYQMTPAIAINLGYDDREPIKTWESRALPDSLFQNAGRVGWRTGLSWRGAGGKRVSLWGSLRTRDKEDANTTSWNARIFLPRLTSARLDFNLSVRGFEGPYLSGLAPNLGIFRTSRSGLRLGLEGGYYVYSENSGLDDRDNLWLKMMVSRNLNRNWSAHADYRQDWGDNIQGQRWFLEMRRRF